MNNQPSRGETALVSHEMEAGFRAADADEPLDRVVSRIEPGRCTPLPVLWHGHLAGLLTAENVGEYSMIRSALRTGGRPGMRPPLPPVYHPAGRPFRPGLPANAARSAT